MKVSSMTKRAKPLTKKQRGALLRVMFPGLPLEPAYDPKVPVKKRGKK